jgi:hypothetical protein
MTAFCHYDCIFATVTSVVAVFLYFWQSDYFSCANKNVFAQEWMRWFCPHIFVLPAWPPIVRYDYTICTATLLLPRSCRPEWQLIHSMLESRDECTRQDNISKLLQNQVEFWPLLCGERSPCLPSYHCFTVLTCNELGAYSSSEHTYMVLKLFFFNLRSSMLFRFIFHCR